METSTKRNIWRAGEDFESAKVKGDAKSRHADIQLHLVVNCHREELKGTN